MSKQGVVVREYREADYAICEGLVSDAWKFDENFKPKDLSVLAKYMYTMGSVAGSNFRRVVEIENKVAGFIFGLNEKGILPKKSVVLGLSIMRRLIFIKGMSFKAKIRLLSAMNTHELNRFEAVGRGKSELVLFVVSPEYQGLGYGKKLLSEFLIHCNQYGVKSIIVETNKLGASSFYERVGFSHISDFYSPLHEYTTKDGMACMYEYLLS